MYICILAHAFYCPQGSYDTYFNTCAICATSISELECATNALVTSIQLNVAIVPTLHGNDMAKSEKTGDAARRLGIHENTLRNWADEYHDLLSPGASGKGKRGQRAFNDDDLLLLATVSDLRDKGLGFPEIRTILTNGQRVERVPPLPTPEETNARQSIALIPLPEHERALDELKVAREQLAMLRTERDDLITRMQQIAAQVGETAEKHQARVDELNTRIQGLERQLGEATGRLAVQRWVLIVIGVLIVAAVVIGLVIVIGGNNGIR